MESAILLRELILPLGTNFMALVLFGSVAYLVYKYYRIKIETISKLLEKSTEISPEFLERLWIKKPHNADLRKGVIWSSAGLTLTISLVLNFGIESSAYGLIPLAIGISYLYLHKYG